MRACESTLVFLRAGATAVVVALAALSPAADTGATAGWPWWRGPLGNGTSPDGDPPLRWSERENVRFKVPIDGHGLATPIAWGDLYLRGRRFLYALARTARTADR